MRCKIAICRPKVIYLDRVGVLDSTKVIPLVGERVQQERRDSDREGVLHEFVGSVLWRRFGGVVGHIPFVGINLYVMLPSEYGSKCAADWAHLVYIK